MKNQMKLSIIIISYNTCQMTLNCLSSIYKQTKLSDAEIIVLDNNSSDSSVVEIQKQFPDIKLVALTENIGFSRGNIECIKYAKGDYLLLLNPDTIVLNNGIDRLLSFAMNNEEAGIWGGKTLFSDLSLNPSSCWGKMTVWNLICRAMGLTAVFKNSEFFNSEAYGGWLRDNERKVDIVSGCFFMLKFSTWKQLNGFDETFFMYGEEADLCLRAKKLGYQPMITNEAEIIHFGGASEANKADKMVKLLKAKIMLIRKHWPTVAAPAGIFLMALWPFTRMIIFKLLNMIIKDKYCQKQQMWNDIWLKRNDWLSGY